jgi:hypothetical protein
MAYMEKSIYDLYTLGFIMDQYGWKMELPSNFWWSLPYQISPISVKQFMGFMEKSIYGLM